MKLATCLSADAASAYVDGTLAPGEIDQVDDHIDACAPCRRLLSELARASPRDAAVPSTRSGARRAADDAPPQLARGSQVGRYIVEGLLGVGGMGVVYAARDPELDRQVALKRVRGDLARGEAAQNRLLREAQAMARLSHPNVVNVYDVAVHASHLFIAMELVEGVSLRAWLAETRRGVREVAARFLEAGRGLAAAHAVGLVHGDFKPDNVLCDASGRVRVTDFGLARPLSGSRGERERESPEEPPCTDVGASKDPPPPSRGSKTIGGTPAYMAPELLAGGPGDERSDQFAFCVALHEALYDTRPFAGDTLEELAAAMRAERVAPEPAGTSVPARLRAALLVGLKADPAARHASIATLLRELDLRPPRRAARAMALALVVGLVGVTAGVGLTRSWEARASARACELAGEELSGIWDETRAKEVRASFLSTGSSFAAAAFSSVRRVLDEHAADWSRARVGACRATRVNGAQSEQLLDLRVQCLGTQRQSLRALAESLVHADALVVENAVTYAETLPPASRCDAERVVREPAAAPLLTSARASVEALRQTLADVGTRAGTGHPAEALAAATAAESAAATLGDPVLESEALWTLGRIQDRADERHPAEETLSRAVISAERIRDDAVIADASTLLARVVIDEGGALERAEDWSSRAEVALERLGEDPARRVAILDSRRFALARTGRYAEALAMQDRELALLEQAAATPRLALARALRQRAQLLESVGRSSEALASVERAYELQSDELGPTHPEAVKTQWIWGDLLSSAGRFGEAITRLEGARSLLMAGPELARHELVETLNSLGNAYEGQGDYGQALASYEASGALAEEAFGPEDRAVGRACSNRSLVYLDLGRTAEAVVVQEKALRIWRAGLGPTHPDVANAESILGEALLADHRPAEAVGTLRHALGLLGSSLGPDHPRVAIASTTLGEALLATHAPAEAVVVLERALDIETAHRGNPLDLPWTGALLGRALLATGGNRARARQLLKAAASDLPALGVRGAEVAARVEAWHL